MITAFANGALSTHAHPRAVQYTQTQDMFFSVFVKLVTSQVLSLQPTTCPISVCV